MLSARSTSLIGAGRAGRFLYPLALLLGFVALLYIAYAIIAEVLYSATGQDLEVTCSARNALSQGSDPYKVSNLGTYLSYPYSPTVAYIAAPLCYTSTIYPKIYMLVYTSIVTLSGLLLGWTLFTTPMLTLLTGLVFFTGFDGLRWLLITGNLAILELPIAIALLIALGRQRFLLAGIILGILSHFKLLPLVYSLAFFFVSLPFRRAVLILFVCVGTFIVILIISFAATPDLFPSFIQQLHGGFPGQHSPYNEYSQGINDPNFIEFYIRFFDRIIDKLSLLESGLSLSFFMIGGAVMYVGKNILKQKEGIQITFALVILLLSLTLFRLKPYAYMTLVPFGVVIVAYLGRWTRLIGMISLGSSCFLWRKLPSLVFDRSFTYYQLFGLLSFIIISSALLALASPSSTIGGAAAPPTRRTSRA
jgi:Glycosyltransferase family 87